MKRIMQLLFVFLLTAPFAAESGETSIMPGWMRPPEKVQRSFEGTVGIQVTDATIRLEPEEATGWFIARDTVATVAHVFSRQFATAPSEDNTTVKIIFGDGADAGRVGTLLSKKIRQDLALFSVDGFPTASVISLRTEPPKKQELFWWYCKGGALKNQWSLGRFVKEIEEADSYYSGFYVFDVIVGGVERGCSGAPILGADGRAVGWVSGIYGDTDYSEYFHGPSAERMTPGAGGKMIRAGRSIDLEESFYPLFRNQEESSEEHTRMLPAWMLPPNRVDQNFAGVAEIEISDGMNIAHGSAWRIGKHIFATAAHFYNKPHLPNNISARIKKNGKTYNGTLIAHKADSDLAFFRIQEETELPIMRIREEPLKKNELVWWYCAAGLLTDEWSQGRFLGEVPPREALEGKYANNVYLMNTMLGGVHAGCSGAPVFDYEGAVVGLVNGFMAGGSFNNILAIRPEDIRRALEFAESQRENQKGGKK
ncbi:trypsin-like peptidase domain-containing protein [Patescibacteria group bacterium]|nr:trypsin-like peptidase domain-containing protein [Patescibacteria group bacterium]